MSYRHILVNYSYLVPYGSGLKNSPKGSQFYATSVQAVCNVQFYIISASILCFPIFLVSARYSFNLLIEVFISC